MHSGVAARSLGARLGEVAINDMRMSSLSVAIGCCVPVIRGIRIGLSKGYAEREIAGRGMRRAGREDICIDTARGSRWREDR